LQTNFSSIWSFYWAPIINQVANSVQPIFESQGYSASESANLANDYGFGYRQGAYAADSWINAQNNAAVYNNGVSPDLSFNVIWADIEDGSKSSPTLLNSTGSNGWLIPTNQYTEYQNISIWNGFTPGVFAEENFINLQNPVLSIFPGIYSEPSKWDHYTGSAPLNGSLEWTAAFSVNLFSNCPSNTNYFSGFGNIFPEFFGDQSASSSGALMWQFGFYDSVTGISGDFDQINLNTFSNDLYYLQGNCGAVVQICLASGS
jgi:hypothetical protein